LPFRPPRIDDSASCLCVCVCSILLAPISPMHRVAGAALRCLPVPCHPPPALSLSTQTSLLRTLLLLVDLVNAVPSWVWNPPTPLSSSGSLHETNLSLDRLLEIPLPCPSCATMCHAVLTRSHTTASSPAIRPYAHTPLNLFCAHAFDLPLFQPSWSAKSKRLSKKRPNLLQTYSLAPVYGGF